ncbi:metal ABC transporter solute-binding protein, Zn/Mn family [Terribacillus sp. DMT04]|uniref:metal ABC transporter solute-binding protein, Zn/Mn family n=1 Tax=Terribacillus sp. DMT04 TaxID=2850441 RepID=UPI001C2C2733|nr:zinc ABC transporter substrate-binding protein [Terribacillus sp. DMT04]QXE01202.1 zinc ABC transporter substrate-binding protein [Terribacillus sp. DMT04]
MFKKSLFAISTALLLVLLAACSDGGSQNSTEDGKMKIYTTIYPIQYFTEQIGGDSVDVESVLPPGSDAHSFEPTSNQIVDIAKANAFLYSSDELETYAGTIADAIGDEDVTIKQLAGDINLLPFGEEHDHSHEGEAAAEEEHDHSHEGEAAAEEEHDHSHEGEAAAEEEHDHSHEGETAAEEEHDHSHEGEAAAEEEHNHSHGDEAAEEEHDHSDEGAAEEAHHHDHGSMDPHYWLDPERAKQMAENIKDTLVELDSDNKAAYEENYKEVAEKLDELDQKFQQTVEGKENKKIIVSHAAYGYWEDRYGIEQIAITGLSPTNEPSQQELENIIHTAEENKLNYVLFEQNVSPKVATIVQDEIEADVLRIHNLETITEEEVNDGEDYFSLMNHNIETLEQALTNK